MSQNPVNEPSGSHHVVQRVDGGLRIDHKTLAMAALFLVGGAGTGAGTSLLGGHGVEEKMDRLTEKVEMLARAVERRTDADEIYRSRIDDHEKRIRDLERKVP